MRNYYCFLGSALGFGKPWSLTYSSLSRQSSKVNFQLCSRRREALVFDLVFFASAKLKSELSALLSASGSLRDGFGMGSGFVNMEVYVIVPSKSQVSPS